VQTAKTKNDRTTAVKAAFLFYRVMCLQVFRCDGNASSHEIRAFLVPQCSSCCSIVTFEKMGPAQVCILNFIKFHSFKQSMSWLISTSFCAQRSLCMMGSEKLTSLLCNAQPNHKHKPCVICQLQWEAASHPSWAGFIGTISVFPDSRSCQESAARTPDGLKSTVPEVPQLQLRKTHRHRI